MKVGCIVYTMDHTGWKPKGKLKVIKMSKYAVAAVDEAGKVFTGCHGCFRVLSYGEHQ